MNDPTCVCPTGLCRDPWAYLCVGSAAAATEWAIRGREGAIQLFGPHEQSARQAAMVWGVLLRRPVGTTEWEATP